MSTRSICVAALLTAATALAGCSLGSDSPDSPASDAPSGPATVATEPSTPTTAGAGTPSGTPQARGEEGDIAFARAMIPHHEQAIEMSALALDRQHGASEQVRALARQITATTTPEITRMTGWLEQWGVEERETALPSDGPAGEGGSGGEGSGGEGSGGDVTVGDVTVETATATDGPAGGEPGGEASSPGSAPSPGAHGDHLGVMSPESMEELGAAQGTQFDQLWLEMMIDHHAGAVRSSRDVLQTTGNADVRSVAERIVADRTTRLASLRSLLKASPPG